VAQRAIVVGAGAVGIASAYYLQRAGFDVTVVDRGAVGTGCSYGTSCLIVPSHSDPLPGPGVLGPALRSLLSRTSPFYIRPRLDAGLAAFCLRFQRYCNRTSSEQGFAALSQLSRLSLGLFEELVSQKEADFFFRRDGLLEVYLTEARLARARRALDNLRSHGFPARLLSREEAVALEPALSPSIAGAVFIESEAHGSSFGYVEALARTVERRGGRLLTGHPVTELSLRGRRVAGVRANGDGIEAEVVVLAAGSWSRRLAAAIGLRIPLQPAKGYSATVDVFEGAPSVPLLVMERRVTVTPLGKRVRFGGTLELAGFDSRIDRHRYRAVVNAAKETLKTEFPMKNEEPWCGFRPVMPDGLPIIDRPSSVEGLVIATGHAMLGFTQSPATGKLVAELASGKSPSISLEPFRLNRF
jgi:D-amino-acid dehydrogenase